MKKLIFISYIIIILEIFQLQSQDFVKVPELKRPVMDLVGILKPEEIKNIERKILQLQKEKGSQIAVLIIETTKPEPIEEYSMRVVEKWKLGRKGIDDGVLFLIAYKDKKMRLEIGYGLEGVIPDAKAKEILEDYVKPYFKKGDFYKGIYTCIDVLIKLINNEPLPEPVRSNTVLIEKNNDFVGSIIFIFVASLFHIVSAFINFSVSKLKGFILTGLDIGLIFVLALVLPFWLAIFLAVFPIWFITLFSSGISGAKSKNSINSWGSSNSWSSSSSSWSGSSGGFSGGGGSFGGGGASSSW
ncbi:MAG: hypothetical protein KatS3mg129_2016 [Leptospiraceae bacterium]|nr:MAG: hypothetical protein KatS3mg129_2016 [Leptospiraceae bacterium]